MPGVIKKIPKQVMGFIMKATGNEKLKITSRLTTFPTSYEGET